MKFFSLEFEPQQLYKIFTIALITFVFVLTSLIILSMNLPLGSDAYFHLGLSRFIGQGNWTGAIDMMFSVNQSPYPPLYHILIAPIAISPDPYTGLRILEMLFLPVTFMLVLWLTNKADGHKAALITGLVLIGSWSFLDGAIQARPESLDLLLYPLILWAALYTRKKWFGALSAITIYSHGFAALSNMWGIGLKLFKQKQWRKPLILTVLVVLPIIIMSFYYFDGAMKQWATYTPTENPQEALFWTYPPWIPYYAGITLMGFAFLIRNIIRKDESELENLLKWSIFGNLIMLPFWADRWLQYSAIPLSMLVGLGVSRWHGWKLYLVLFAIALGSWIYISNFLLISYYGQWWQPGHFWNMPPPT